MALERPKAEPGRYLKELPTRGNQVKRIQREIGKEDLKQRTGLASVEGRRRWQADMAGVAGNTQGGEKSFYVSNLETHSLLLVQSLFFQIEGSQNLTFLPGTQQTLQELMKFIVFVEHHGGSKANFLNNPDHQ